MIVCGACGFSQVMQKAYAEDLTITRVTLSIFNSDKTSTPQTKENDPITYLAEYQPNTSPHYPSFYIQSTILTDPSDAVVDNSVSSQMKWFVNNVEIDFSENNYIDTNAEYSINREQDSALGVYFTPKLPRTFTILCKLTYNGTTYESNILLESEYAVPTDVTVETSGGSTTQDFENFENITLTAKLSPENYVNKNPGTFTYTWYKNNPDEGNIVGNEAVFVVTKSILENKIGETKFYVRVKGGGIGGGITGKELEYIVTVKLTTSSDYEIKVTTSGGSLEQKLGGDNLEPIQFTATITPIPEKYNVEWYLLKVDSSIYEKQPNKSTDNKYTLNLANLKSGTYNVFARLTDTSTKEQIISNITTVTLLSKEVEVPSNVTNLIKEEKHDVKSTGVEGFTLTIDINLDEYPITENDIVWYVNGGKITNSNGSSCKGKTFSFDPPVAGEYSITVKLIKTTSEGVKYQSQWGFVTVTAKSTTVNLMWFYIALSITLLLAICVLSIMISNKLREKIW